MCAGFKTVMQGLLSEDLETKIASVYQVQAHQSDLSPLRELLLRDGDLTKWVRTEWKLKPSTLNLYSPHAPLCMDWSRVVFCSGDGSRRQVGGWWCKDESTHWQVARLFLCCGLLPAGRAPSTVRRLGYSSGIRHVNCLDMVLTWVFNFSLLDTIKHHWDCMIINPVSASVIVSFWPAYDILPWEKQRKTFETSCTAKDYSTHMAID